MAKRRRRPAKKQGVSPVASMLFGLAVGLSVAVAVYVKDREDPAGGPSAPNPTPASMQSALDDNGEGAAGPIAAQTAPTEKEEPRFTFYTLLPDFEVVTRDEEPVTAEVVDGPSILDFQHVVRRIPVTNHVFEYAAALVRATRPDEAYMVQLITPVQELMAALVGEAESLTALRGAYALVHGYVMLELNEQLRRGGDLEAVYQEVIRAYLRGWEL